MFGCVAVVIEKNLYIIFHNPSQSSLISSTLVHDYFWFIVSSLDLVFFLAFVYSFQLEA